MPVFEPAPEDYGDVPFGTLLLRLQGREGESFKLNFGSFGL